MVTCSSAQVSYFLHRLTEDWDRLHVKKPWSFKDAQLIHATCGVFISLMDTLQAEIPEQDWLACRPRMHQQFMSGFLDAECQHVLDTAVPPVQLTTVGFIRRRALDSCSIRIIYDIICKVCKFANILILCCAFLSMLIFLVMLFVLFPAISISFGGPS